MSKQDGPPARTVGEAAPLRLRTKFAFGAGSAAETIALFALSSYALLFYNQVIGLPAWMAGLAISVSFVFDGLADPVIGSLSDRTRSRWGRRHPFMFAAPLPIALFFVAIFNPPAGMGHAVTFIWFMLAVSGLRVSMGFFHTPHLALGGELSQSYLERSRVMAWNNFALWFGGTAMSVVSLNLFFRSTPEYPMGLLNPAPYLPFSLVAAVAVMAILLGSAWFTRDQIPRLPQPSDDTPPFSPFEFFRDVRKVLANRNYLWLLAGLFALSLMAGFRDALQLYVNTYYWRLSSEQISWFSLGSFVGYLCGFVLTPRLHAIFSKRQVIIWAAVGNSIFPGLGVTLHLSGFMYDAGDPRLLPALVAIAAGTFATSAALNISAMSALADVADENELKFGLRQEGILYSTRALFSKLDVAIGSALAGAFLTFAAFPQKATPGQVDPAIIERLGWFFGPILTIPGLIAACLYAQYRITKASHAETRAQIEELRTRRNAILKAD
jgi:GPH family glycoside/pentoside/hexuronide:cation symporter